MRGLITLFTREKNLTRYRTGVFVASTERDILEILLPQLADRFPGVVFTMLAPEAYANIVQPYGKLWGQEGLSSRPLAALAALRRSQFDVCVVTLGGRPTFRKTKLAALFFNVHRMFMYDEHGDVIPLDCGHWHALVAHLFSRCTRLHFGALFFPFGFTYLLIRTAWLSVRAWRVARTSLE